MRSGRLRQQITLQSKYATRDAMGGEIISWPDHATVRAAVEPLRGREFFASQEAQSEINIRFRIRYLAEVTSGWRVVWETRAYDITEVIDIDGRHVELHLMARTMQNA